MGRLPRDSRDRAAVLRDEAAALRDQAADLRDHAAVLRDEVAELREQGGGQFDPESIKRDRSADRRDREADRRDREADRRDREASQGDGPGTTAFEDAGNEARRSAAADRRDAGRDRAAAAKERTAASRDRVASSLDRGASAGDRTLSAVDRGVSSEDRTVSAVNLREASIDGLTGAYVRGAGMIELERDFSRSVRAGQPFTVAFVDVDGLKEVNDFQGHVAGDRLLNAVAQTLRATLRPYDLIVRYGGDEFVCALSGITASDVAARMALVNETLLARSEVSGSITVGFAELQTGDSVEDLIVKADAALYEARRRRVGSE